MKRGVLIIFFCLLIAIILFAIIELKFGKIKIEGKAILENQLPTEHTYQNIQTVWETFFKESFSGAAVFINDSFYSSDKIYLAYKILGNDLYVLFGIDESYTRYSSQNNYTHIYASKITGNNNIIQELQQNSSLIINNYLRFIELLFKIIYPSNQTTERVTKISDVNSAGSEFFSIFKINSSVVPTGEWITDEGIDIENGLDYNMFTFDKNEYASNTTEELMGVVYGNISHSLIFYSYNIGTYITCIPNWTFISSFCGIKDKMIERYQDNNYCDYQSTSSVETNEDCDYNRNNIIGNLSEITIQNLGSNINLSINNFSLNPYLAYSGLNYVNITDSSGKNLIGFTWNFSSPLNLRKISIKKQGPSDNRGYIIINGINTSKKVTINKINNLSDSVCVKNIEIQSISEISTNCNSREEYLVNCSKNSSQFNCSIVENTTYGDLFIVYGLTNSAVLEMIGSPLNVTCISQWNCSWNSTDMWSECINGTRQRTCVDYNNCANETNKPSEIENCIPPCTPLFNCTEWKPKKCPKNQNQTRTCIDTNNCGIEGGDTESRTCEYERNLTRLIIIISATGVIAIIITIILVIVSKKNRGYIKSENLTSDSESEDDLYNSK